MQEWALGFPDAIPVFQRLGDDTGAARAWMTIASAHNHVGHHALGLEAAERALAHAERAGNEALVRNAYRLIGVGIVWGPLPLAEGVRRYGDLVDRVEGGPLKRAATAAVVAALNAQLGQIDESRALTARAREIYDEIGDPVSGATLALQEHRGPLGVGDFATAEAIVAEACATLDAAGERSRYSTAVAIHAGTLYGLGRFDEAYRATMASEAAGSEDDVVTQAYWRAERAKVLARWGRADEAVGLAHDALRRIETTDGLLETADVYGDLGEVMMVLGRPEEAKSAWRESIQRYEAKGAQPFAALMRGKLERLEPGDRAV
jgi:tetratricopeptide (TPR) repeat protein